MTSGFAVATLVVFIISIFFVIHPVTIPIPRHFPRIPINLTTAPILAIALLWAAQCLDLMVIRNGIVGTEGIKPHNILILFFSLAYMVITLDITRVLEAAAFWVSNMSGRTGWKVYLHFVMLALLSIPLGNDPAMLSGTAFLVYYTDVAKLDSWAWVMAEFAAANTASMVLFVGNPTNVVICEGFGVNDAAFTAYTILPFLACNVFCFAVLAFQYRNKVPRTLARTTRRNPREALLDPVGAWVGSIMLGTTLILCLVVSFFGIDVWMISLPFAVGKFLFDLTWDHYRRAHGIPIKLGRRSPKTEGVDESSAAESEQYAENSASQPTVMGQSPPPPPDEEMAAGLPLRIPQIEPKMGPQMSPKADGKGLDEASMPEQHQHTMDSFSRPSSFADTKRSPSFPHDEATAVESHPEIETPKLVSKTVSQSDPVLQEKFIMRFRSYLDEHFPTFNTALPRLPFALIPFAFSQFILIEALNHTILACNVFCLAALAFQCRNKVLWTLARTAHRKPREARVDLVGAWVGSIMLGATLIFCLVVTFFGIDAWMISLPFAVGKVLFDIGWDHHRHTYPYPNPTVDRGSPRVIGKSDHYVQIGVHQRAEDTSAYCASPDEDRSRYSLLDEATPFHQHSLGTSVSGREFPKAGEKGFGEGYLAEEHQHTQNNLPHHHRTLADTIRSPSLPPDEGNAIESQFETSNIESKTKPQPSAPKANIKMSRVLRELRADVDYQLDRLDAHFPTFITSLSRLPLSLIPFTYSQFILVEALDQHGWVQEFADWIVRTSGNQIHHTTWLVGVLGVILCNFSGTNIGITLLFAKVVRAAFLPYGGNCAAAVAFSLGAVSFTFSASLAGFLWRTILAQKDTHVRQGFRVLESTTNLGHDRRRARGRFGRNGSSISVVMGP